MELTVQDIYKSFGEKQVLTGISFGAAGGKAMGILGRNGAGKTTTIRILMNVFPANSGQILMDGKPIDYHTIQTGYLPEERGLYPKKKIIDQLVYFAQLKGMSHTAAVKSVDQWLDRLDMTAYRNKRLDVLSKGNQQKIQLITALAHDPQIVMLDEPFSGLDPVNAMLLKDVVKQQIAQGKIVLFSSHQMNYIEEFCDDIAILNEGKIVLQGDLQQIKRDDTRDKLIVRSPNAEQIITDLHVPCSVNDKKELVIQLDAADQKQHMMKTLAETYDIDEIKVFEPSLQDIFVRYTADHHKGACHETV